jgi:hypothetical protein
MLARCSCRSGAVTSSAFTLVQFAFSQGFMSRRFFQDSGRRALALAGAQHYVWDWQPEDEELYIGEEITRASICRRGSWPTAASRLLSN